MSGNDIIEGIELGAELGQGGAGQVYRGIDLDFQREVAVKILRDPGSEKDRAQWDRERVALGRVGSHPGIATVHRAGRTTETDRPFVVMELIDGDTADRWLAAQGQVQVSEIVRIATAVAEAIAFANSQGVIHGDLKPSNILIRQNGEPVVVDFGISRVIGTTATDFGAAGFTFGYVAPELMSGERLSERCDVYGLAATVYALLSGRAPHNIEPGAHLAAAVAQVMQGEITPLPDTIAPPVRAAVHAGLARDPQQRPATARDFAAMLAAPGGIEPGQTVGQDTWLRQSASEPFPTDPSQPNSGPANPTANPASHPQPQPQVGFSAPSTPTGAPPLGPGQFPQAPPGFANQPVAGHGTQIGAPVTSATVVQPDVEPPKKSGRSAGLIAALAVALLLLVGGGAWAVLSQGGDPGAESDDGQGQALEDSIADDGGETDSSDTDAPDTGETDGFEPTTDNDENVVVKEFNLQVMPTELTIPAGTEAQSESTRRIEVSFFAGGGDKMWIAIDRQACNRWGSSSPRVTITDPQGERIAGGISPCRGDRGLDRPFSEFGTYVFTFDIPDNGEMTFWIFNLLNNGRNDLPFQGLTDWMSRGGGLFSFGFEGTEGQALVVRPSEADCDGWGDEASARLFTFDGDEVARALSPCLGVGQMLDAVLPSDGLYTLVFEVRAITTEEVFELSIFDALSVDPVELPFSGAVDQFKVDGDRLYAFRFEASEGDQPFLRPSKAACDRWFDSPTAYVYDSRGERVSGAVAACLTQNQVLDRPLTIDGTHALLFEAPDDEPFEMSILGDVYSPLRQIPLPFNGDLSRFSAAPDSASFFIVATAGDSLRITPDAPSCAEWGREQPEFVITGPNGDRVSTVMSACDSERNLSDPMPVDGRYHVQVVSPTDVNFDAQVVLE